MAAGEKVVGSTRSRTYIYLRSHYNDAVAVDMEGRGLLEVAYLNSLPAIVIRGISDLIDKKAEADSSGWQERAARHAAAFTAALLARVELEGSEEASPSEPVRDFASDAARTNQRQPTAREPRPEASIVRGDTPRGGRGSARADFLISYSQPDQPWAEWIAKILEDAAYHVIVQAWDFKADSDVALELERATREADRTIAVLSPAYVASGFTGAEWAVAFAADPRGMETLLPVRVQDFEVEGLLKAISYIDLANLDENQARMALLHGVRAERRKPSVRISYPGRSEEPPFPGDSLRRAGLGASPGSPTDRPSGIENSQDEPPEISVVSRLKDGKATQLPLLAQLRATEEQLHSAIGYLRSRPSAPDIVLDQVKDLLLSLDTALRDAQDRLPSGETGRPDLDVTPGVRVHLETILGEAITMLTAYRQAKELLLESPRDLSRVDVVAAVVELQKVFEQVLSKLETAQRQLKAAASNGS